MRTASEQTTGIAVACRTVRRFWTPHGLAFSIALLIALPACSGNSRLRCNVVSNKAYIDTVGYRAFTNRQQILGDGLFNNPDSAVRMALRPMDEAAQGSAARDSGIFAEIEQSYQRYLTLFRVQKNAGGYELCFPYNLIATLETGMVDRQPFMNAILHSLGLTDLTTLDFSLQRLSADQLLVTVMWSAPAKTIQSGIHIAEGEQQLYVSPHTASLQMKN